MALLSFALASVAALIPVARPLPSTTPYQSQFPAGHVPFQQAPSYYPGSPWSFAEDSSRPCVCHIEAAPNGEDSAPAIRAAFEKCGQNGKVIFDNTTYHINTAMKTTGLSNLEVDIRGTLLWGTDIQYWLNNSLAMGYQNQSTAWIFGGDKIHWHGNGYGTLNGNGQVWYDFINGTSNYPRRPHQITYDGLTNSVIEQTRFLQSQMWTMTLINSANVLLQDIYVNNTSTSSASDINTDGADTIYSNNITFTRWVVDNGDDSIAWKANSTNILVTNCSFYRGSGLALGSIGQFLGQFETIENVVSRNVFTYGTAYAGAYAKTWTGIQQGYPPNGGGGGTGYMRNIVFENFTVSDSPRLAYITQCNSYSGATGGCDTSYFQISDVHFRHMRGTLSQNEIASLQCSGAAPCPGIEISDVQLTFGEGGLLPATKYLCSNVSEPVGFVCNGSTPQT